jgi:hypothetical protein
MLSNSLSTPCRLFSVFLLISLSACSTSPEVRLTSANALATTEELGKAVTAFQDLYLGEIDKARSEVEKAFVSRAVRQEITALSTHFGEPEWTNQFKAKGLITVSGRIEQTEDSARALVREVMQLTPPAGKDPQDLLVEFFAKQTASMRSSAAELRRSGQTQSADDLDTRAKTQEQMGSHDPRMRSYLQVLVQLGAMRRETPKNLEQLTQIVTFLQNTQGEIHKALMTDITLSGKNVGEFVGSHAKQLGLSAPAGGTQ